MRGWGVGVRGRGGGGKEGRREGEKREGRGGGQGRECKRFREEGGRLPCFTFV